MPGSTSLCPATHEPRSESVRVEGCTGWDGFDEGERQDGTLILQDFKSYLKFKELLYFLVRNTAKCRNDIIQNCIFAF